MKKFLTYTLMLLAIFATDITFTACGDDPVEEPEKPKPQPVNTGEDNQTDVAVTGGVDNIDITSATVIGYVNLPDEMKLLMGTTLKIGVELANNEQMDKATKYEAKSLIGNRKFTISLTKLIPNKTYYYRTYVENGSIPIYGETYSFATPEAENITRTGEATDITPTSATLSCVIVNDNQSNTIGAVGIIYTTNQKELDIEYVYKKEADYSSIKDYTMRTTSLSNVKDKQCSYELNELKQNTTYYYCSYYRVGDTQCIGEVKSFKTPSAYDYYIDECQFYVASVPPVPSTWDFKWYVDHEAYETPRLNLAAKVKFKNTDRDFLGCYGISINENYEVDEEGRLVDQFMSYPVPGATSNITTNIMNRYSFPFPYFVSGNKGLPTISNETLETGKRYYYQVYFFIISSVYHNYTDGTPAFTEIKQITAGATKFSFEEWDFNPLSGLYNDKGVRIGNTEYNIVPYVHNGINGVAIFSSEGKATFYDKVRSPRD